MSKLILCLVSASFAPLSVTLASLFLPEIGREYGAGFAVSSLVPALRGGGELVGALACAYFVARFGLWKTFRGGLLYMAFACAALVWPGPFPTVLAVIFMAGLATAFLVTAGSSLMATLDPVRPAPYVGMVFTSLGAGQVTWPLLMGWPYSLGVSWRVVALGTGLLALAVFAGQALAGPPEPRRRSAASPSAGASSGGTSLAAAGGAGVFRVLAHKEMRKIAGLYMLWMVHYMVLVTWLSTYAVEVLQAGAGGAGFAFTVFMAGVFVSRLALIHLSGRYSARPLILAGCAGGALFNGAFILTGDWERFLACVFLTGLASGAGVPSFMNLAGERLGNSSSVFGGLLAASLVSVTITPALTGWLAQQVGFRPMFWLGPAAAAVTLGLLLRYKGAADPAWGAGESPPPWAGRPRAGTGPSAA